MALLGQLKITRSDKREVVKDSPTLYIYITHLLLSTGWVLLGEIDCESRRRGLPPASTASRASVRAPDLEAV